MVQRFEPFPLTTRPAMLRFVPVYAGWCIKLPKQRLQSRTGCFLECLAAVPEASTLKNHDAGPVPFQMNP